MKPMKFLFNSFIALLIAAACFAANTADADCPDQALRFAQRAATQTYTYNYLNYETRLTEISHFFTPKGWHVFQSALKRSGNLKYMVKNKISMSAVATGQPKAISSSENRRWGIKVPIRVTYQNSPKMKQQNLMVTMEVIKSNGRYDYAVQSFIAKPNKK